MGQIRGAADQPDVAGELRQSPTVQNQPRDHDHHLIFHYTEHGPSVLGSNGDEADGKETALRFF